MNNPLRETRKTTFLDRVAAALCVVAALGTTAVVKADEADAKRLLKAMSDYMAAQEILSFAFDAVLEVVTHDDQTLQLASSGSLTLNRPDKIRVARSGGFTDIQMSFDGKTLTLLGKTANLYAQLDVPGTVDHLIDEIRLEHGLSIPGADLVLSNSYDELMLDVNDVKDLGSGVIGGVECDYFAFRTDEVDWQIWIAQGDHPYPCRFVINSKLISGTPQYSVQISDWKTGDEVAATDFDFQNTTDAAKVEVNDFADDLPDHFVTGDAQ